VRVWRKRIAALVLALVVYGLDQAIKAWVVGPLALPVSDPIEVLPIFNLTFTRNYGVSLGLFHAGTVGAMLALVALTGLIALGVLVWLLRERHLPELLALGLVLGGAAGNITDRISYGFVVDYADLHFGEWRPFLIFNLADAAITIGVVIILARSLLSREKPAQRADTAPEN
jgi:signal peptidase II